MEVAVLSDIHGNYIALNKCINYCLSEGIQNFIFLGDYLGELAFPQRTMEFLYKLKEEYNCLFIKGNKEDYWLNYDSTWKENSSTTGALYYTYHNLTDRDLKFFGELKHKEIFSVNGLSAITVCHGSPNKVNEKLLADNENTFRIMDESETDYIICGHTHIQGIIKHNNKVIFNPGAVGVPLFSKGKAQFLIMHPTEKSVWESEFISIDYDVSKVIEDLYSSGLYDKAPYWCIVSENLLRAGEISHGEVLGRAMELCREEKGECNWPDIDEKYWELAVKEVYGK